MVRVSPEVEARYTNIQRSFETLKRKSNGKQAYMSFNFYGLSKIDLTEQSFEADLSLKVRWFIEAALENYIIKHVFSGDEDHANQHKRVEFDEISKLLLSKYGRDLEVPSITIKNAVTCENDKWSRIRYYPMAEEGQRLEGTWNMRSKGVFFERLELQDFPFDAQNLKIICTCDRDNFILVKETNVRCSHLRRTSFHLQEYVLHYPVFAATVKDAGLWDSGDAEGVFELASHPADSSTQSIYSQVGIVNRVERTLNYYIWNHFLILFLLSTIALGSVFVDPLAFHDRCSITLTIILTVVAFKFILVDQLPKTGYLTLLDTYILSCFQFVLLMVAENAAAAIWPEVFKVEMVVAFVLGVVWICWQFLFSLWVYRAWSRGQKCLAASDAVWEQYLHVANDDVKDNSSKAGSDGDTKVKAGGC